MSFVLIYRNNSEIRKHIENWIRDATKRGLNPVLQPVNTSFFSSRLSWPSYGEIANWPMNLQVEEVKWEEEKLVSVKCLIIDVEVVIIQEVNTTS
jgi:hypothetical protein